MSSEECRRNAQPRSQKKGKMTLDFPYEESHHKGARKKVKTRLLQDLVSDRVDRQAHVVKPQVKKLLSDAFRSIERRINTTTPMDPRTPLPDQSKLEFLLSTLQSRDSKKIFAEPVDPMQVKGYQDAIKDPMDFGTIGMKLSRGKYNALEDFEHDVFLVSDNALKFNRSSTVYYRQARAIREVAENLFHALRTDPTDFEKLFRFGRWTEAEARLPNSTDQMISSRTKGKRNEESAYQCHQNYQPPAEEKLLASDVPKNRKTLMEAKEELGPMVKSVTMRDLCQNLPQGSVPQNKVAAARSVHQGSVHRNAFPALTDFSYRNPARAPHLNSHAQSGRFYGGNVLPSGGMDRSEDPRSIIPEARIPQPQDQASLHDARHGSVSDVQDAGTHDHKGKKIMEQPSPSPSRNIPRWFLG